MNAANELVTVRRCMNYLAESGKVIGEMNYETGGSPVCFIELWSKEWNFHSFYIANIRLKW